MPGSQIDSRGNGIVTILPAKEGDCLDDSVRKELEEAIKVDIPPVQVEAPCIGANPNSILSVDLEGCFQAVWTPPQTICQTIIKPTPGNNTAETSTTIITGFDIPLDGIPVLLNVSPATSYEMYSYTVNGNGDLVVTITKQTTNVELCATAFLPQVT